MKRPRMWALCAALQVGACGLAGCNSAPPLPAVGSQAHAQPVQTVEQMMAAARFMENQGVQHSDSDKLELARQGYLTVLARQPNNQFAHHRLAIMAARGGLYDMADVHFQKALSTGAASSELLADMGYNYYLQNRLDEAEKSLRDAIAKDARNETAINNLGIVLGESGRMDEALASFERVVGAAQAHANVAKVHTHMGNLEAAKQEYNLALSIDGKLRNAAEALVQLENATRSRAVAHNAREQFASHERPAPSRPPAPARQARQQRELPDFDTLAEFTEADHSATQVRPVSQQTPAREMKNLDGSGGSTATISPGFLYDQQPRASSATPQASSPRVEMQQPAPQREASPPPVDPYKQFEVSSDSARKSVPDIQPAEHSMADIAANLGGQSNIPEAQVQPQADVQPVVENAAPVPQVAARPLKNAPVQRVESSARHLQSTLAQQQAPVVQQQPVAQQPQVAQQQAPVVQQEPKVFAEPPLPGGQPEFKNFQQPRRLETKAVALKSPAHSLPPSEAQQHPADSTTASTDTMSRQSRPEHTMSKDVAPANTMQANTAPANATPANIVPARIDNPFVAAQGAAHAADAHQSQLYPVATGARETVDNYFDANLQEPPRPLAAAMIEDKLVDNKQSEPASVRAAQPGTIQISQPAANDLPPGEPGLGPIVAAQTASPLTAQPRVITSSAPAGKSPFDFRIPSGVQPHSLQKLVDDDDY